MTADEDLCHNRDKTILTDREAERKSETMNLEISNALDNIVREHDVCVLFACESGSRAWGFPSEDSDWDVRFLYAHRPEWYLSVFPGRDVIERPRHRSARRERLGHPKSTGTPAKIESRPARVALLPAHLSRANRRDATPSRPRRTNVQPARRVSPLSFGGAKPCFARCRRHRGQTQKLSLLFASTSFGRMGDRAEHATADAFSRCSLCAHPRRRNS